MARAANAWLAAAACVVAGVVVAPPRAGIPNLSSGPEVQVSVTVTYNQSAGLPSISSPAPSESTSTEPSDETTHHYQPINPVPLPTGRPSSSANPSPEPAEPSSPLTGSPESQRELAQRDAPVPQRVHPGVSDRDADVHRDADPDRHCLGHAHRSGRLPDTHPDANGDSARNAHADTHDHHGRAGDQGDSFGRSGCAHAISDTHRGDAHGAESDRADVPDVDSDSHPVVLGLSAATTPPPLQ